MNQHIHNIPVQFNITDVGPPYTNIIATFFNPQQLNGVVMNCNGQSLVIDIPLLNCKLSLKWLICSNLNFVKEIICNRLFNNKVTKFMKKSKFFQVKFLSSEIAKYYFGVVYYILLYFIHKLKVIQRDIQQAELLI